MDEEVYRYHPMGFSDGLLRGLCKLRKSAEFCDIQLLIERQVFLAHRCVLAAASPYFGAMFGGGLSEHDKTEVTIHNVAPSIFNTILDFMYSGEVCVTESNCQELLMAADMLGVSEVIEGCSAFLTSQLCVANVLGILMFAESHHCIDLQRKAEQFVHNHFLEVSRSEEFSDVPKELLLRLLQSEDLHIENEFQVFEAALSWVLHDPRTRRPHIFDILGPVRFPIIPQKSLQRYLDDCPDLSLRVALRKHAQDFHGFRRLTNELRLSRLKPCHLQPRRRSRKSLYVIGGYSREPGGRWGDSTTLATVECFDSFTQMWRGVPTLRHPRSGHGVAVLNGAVYVVGGESDALILDTCEFFSPAVGKWTLLPCMTVPRCGLGVCSMDGCLYALGGWVGTEIGDTVEKYDPLVGHWQQVGRMERLTFAMGVVAHQGLIYLIGGTNDLGAEVRHCVSYNPVTAEWTSLSPLRSERAYVGVTALDDQIYVIGGWNETQAALNSVEVYSIQENKWRQAPPMSCPRAGAAVTAVNGLIYVIGGRTSSDAFSAPSTLATVECFDPQTDSWFEIGPMPSHRCEAMVAVL